MLKQGHRTRWIALGTFVVMLATTLGGAGIRPVQAGVKSRRNTAIALGAATAYLLYKKKYKYAAVGAGATAYAYNRYRNAKQREQAYNGYRSGRYYRSGGSKRYASNRYSGYSSGSGKRGKGHYKKRGKGHGKGKGRGKGRN